VPEPVRLPDAPATYIAHDRLTVDGVEVPWRYVNGVAHAAGDDGLARAVAWSAGVWQARYQLTELLRTPAAAAAIRTESDLDP
jgi:hypothetical protein